MNSIRGDMSELIKLVTSLQVNGVNNNNYHNHNVNINNIINNDNFNYNYPHTWSDGTNHVLPENHILGKYNVVTCWNLWFNGNKNPDHLLGPLRLVKSSYDLPGSDNKNNRTIMSKFKFIMIFFEKHCCDNNNINNFNPINVDNHVNALDFAINSIITNNYPNVKFKKQSDVKNLSCITLYDKFIKISL